MSRPIGSVLILAAVALACGCKSTPKSSSDVGASKMGTFTCRDVKKNVCIGPTDHFKATIPVVHMTYKTKNIPKNGDVYEIKWIAEDVGEAAPANTVIATLNEKVTDILPSSKFNNYVVNSQLTKPTKGWPIGKYRVEVKYGGKLVTTAPFTIK